MLAAVTGATGFIGGELVAGLLRRGDTVRALSRRPLGELGLPRSVAVFRGDLTEQDSDHVLTSFVDGADVVYHCAGEIRCMPQMRPLHVDGVRRLLTVADGRIGHWVQLSSVGAYGHVRNGVITEATPLNPVGPYEQTKMESDQLVEPYADAGGFSYSILRPSIVFGPRMRGRSLFQLIETVRSGLFFFVGPPGSSANYIAVGNVVDALIRCGTMAQARGGTFNLSDYRPLEVFVGLIATALGVRAPKVRLPESLIRLGVKLTGWVPAMPLTSARIDALVVRATYPVTRIAKELEYRHVVSMEQGIGEMVRACNRT